MTFVSHENWVRCIIFHPSGKYIISSSDDKTVRIMDIKVRFLIFLRKFLPMIFIIHTNYLIVIIFHNFFLSMTLFIFMSTFLFDNSDIYYSENIHFNFIFIFNVIIVFSEYLDDEINILSQ